jgi:hypothetical protein
VPMEPVVLLLQMGAGHVLSRPSLVRAFSHAALQQPQHPLVRVLNSLLA